MRASCDLSSCGITRNRIKVGSYRDDPSARAEGSVSALVNDPADFINIDQVAAAPGRSVSRQLSATDVVSDGLGCH